MSWISTYTGKKFYFLDPDLRAMSSRIHLVDIAHSLAKLDRFNGHGHGFYSVAQHSLAMKDYFQGGRHIEDVPYPTLYILMEALLHDGHEAYTGDATRPFKALLGDVYTNIADHIDRAIRRKWDLPDTKSSTVRYLDAQMARTEGDFLLRNGTRDWASRAPALDLSVLREVDEPWRDVKQEFITEFALIWHNVLRRTER